MTSSIPSQTRPTAHDPVGKVQKNRIGTKKIDQITAVVLLIFSGLIIGQSLNMPLVAEYGPDYGFFPFWLGVIMAVLSLALLIDAWRRPKSKDEPSPFPVGKAAWSVFMVLAALGIFTFLLEILGYVISTLMFVGFLTRVVQRDKPRTVILTTLGVTFLLYVIFNLLLGINLPKGFLGF